MKSAEQGGMSEQQFKKSGKVLSHSIKQETIRSLPFVYVDRENFIKSKHWLCSRKLSGGLQENALIATPDTPVCLFSASK
jgi:hypothetical protein